MSDDTAFKVKEKGRDLIKLSQYRRAIANFVNIVTNKNIDVTFSDNNHSYTDGQKVVLFANLDDNNFDPVVGLALHEGSHILLTDFEFIKKLNHGFSHGVIPQELVDDLQLKATNFQEFDSEQFIKEKLKMILNIVEDRRIDYFLYKNAPGYRGYYEALYNKYFRCKIVDKGLMSDEYTSEEWESYEFRLINIVNKNTDLNALKGLREIWDILDIKHIYRLDSTENAYKIALKIYKIINKYAQFNPDSETSKSKTDSNDVDDNNIDSKSKQELSENQKHQLGNAIRKQKDFINNNIKKTKLSKSDYQKIRAMEKANTTVKTVQYDNIYSDSKSEVDVIVVKNLNKPFIDADPYMLFQSDYMAGAQHTQDYINDGIRLGVLLGKKLKITNESRTTNFTRQKRGKIDRRLLAELGCNNDAIFYRDQTDQYKNSFVHISIDGSGSMGGIRIENAIRSSIAIAKAASMNEGIEVVISFRYTTVSAGEYPVVVIAYDSRKDKFSKIPRLFPYLYIAGVTPESLCFDAIKDEITNSVSKDVNKYFINMSDGAPNYHRSARPRIYYGGHVAIKHCKKMIKEFEKNDVKVLSYFISESSSS